MKNKKIIIIGGGIVGIATAYKLGQHYPNMKITVLEKEDNVGKHQTGNNSGVLHAGLYYKPGSAKAKLAVSGIQEMIAFCRENNISHEVCGKLVVATNDSEIPRLHNLLERGEKNGLQGLKLLNIEEMREIEPYVNGVLALRVPQEGIVDYKKVCAVLVDKIKAQGNQVITQAKVNKLTAIDEGWVAETTAGDFIGDFVVNCGGLYCDRISELAGEKREIRIVPFRGEYYKIKPERQYLVKNLIYPVPDPRFPFLGVHFTRLIHGGIEAGPNAVLAFQREGYRKSQIDLKDLYDVFSYSGFWKLISKYWQMSITELQGSFSKKIFCQSLQKLVPEIQPDDLETGGAGVRAQALYPNGELVEDFYFISRKNALHVLNAPSPAATASLAIGSAITNQICQNL